MAKGVGKALNGFHREAGPGMLVGNVDPFRLEKAFDEVFHGLRQVERNSEPQFLALQVEPVAFDPERAVDLRKSEQFEPFAVARFVEECGISCIAFGYDAVQGTTQRILVVDGQRSRGLSGL